MQAKETGSSTWSRGFLVQCVANVAESEDFMKKKVNELQQFLSQGGIQHSNKWKQELVELCYNAKLLNAAAARLDEALGIALQDKLKTLMKVISQNRATWQNGRITFQKLSHSLLRTCLFIQWNRKTTIKRHSELWELAELSFVCGWPRRIAFLSSNTGEKLFICQVWCQTNCKTKDSGWAKSVQWLAGYETRWKHIFRIMRVRAGEFRVYTCKLHTWLGKLT